ncbi:MAG: hypothetical protein WDW38_004939 [Sanguina aurantia]
MGILSMLGVRTEHNPFLRGSEPGGGLSGAQRDKRSRGTSISEQASTNPFVRATGPTNSEGKKQRKEAGQPCISTATIFQPPSSPNQSPLPASCRTEQHALVPAASHPAAHALSQVQPPLHLSNQLERQQLQHDPRPGDVHHVHQAQLQREQRAHSKEGPSLHGSGGRSSNDVTLRSSALGQERQAHNSSASRTPLGHPHQPPATNNPPATAQPRTAALPFSYPSACSALPTFLRPPSRILPSTMHDATSSGGGSSSKAPQTTHRSAKDGRLHQQHLAPAGSDDDKCSRGRTAAAAAVPSPPGAALQVFGASRRKADPKAGLQQGRHVTLYASSGFNHFDNGGGEWDGSCLGMEDVEGADVGSMGWEGLGTRDN